MRSFLKKIYIPLVTFVVGFSAALLYAKRVPADRIENPYEALDQVSQAQSLRRVPEIEMPDAFNRKAPVIFPTPDPKRDSREDVIRAQGIPEVLDSEAEMMRWAGSNIKAAKSFQYSTGKHQLSLFEERVGSGAVYTYLYGYSVYPGMKFRYLQLYMRIPKIEVQYYTTTDDQYLVMKSLRQGNIIAIFALKDLSPEIDPKDSY